MKARTPLLILHLQVLSFLMKVRIPRSLHHNVLVVSLMADLLPFVLLGNGIIYLFRLADFRTNRRNLRRVNWANDRWSNRANPRRTNRTNFYSAVTKRDYLAIDTPTFTPCVPYGWHHKGSNKKNPRNNHEFVKSKIHVVLFLLRILIFNHGYSRFFAFSNRLRIPFSVLSIVD